METIPSESGQVESLRLKKPCGLLLVDLEQLDLKRQLGVRRNRIAGAPCAVPEFRRDDKLPLAADLHAGHAFVPAFDDPARAQGERERPAAILAAVEFRPVLEPTGVVHLEPVAGLGLFALAYLQVFIFQAGLGDVDLVLFLDDLVIRLEFVIYFCQVGCLRLRKAPWARYLFRALILAANEKDRAHAEEEPGDRQKPLHASTCLSENSGGLFIGAFYRCWRAVTVRFKDR